MANEDYKNDPRFADIPANANPTQLSPNGVAGLEDLGDGLVKVTDRDGRVSVLPHGSVDAAHLNPEQRQKAIDVMIDNSPERNDLSPAHSDFNPDATLAVAPDKVEGEKVVNKDLGVDSTDSTPVAPASQDKPADKVA